jgi:hypothetical protein|nr:MAG TPA: hypothetical protein [Caudoviricetes sp.]
MAWRYENPGYRELLVMPGHTVKCDATKSKTGYAFWQNRQLPSFDIPESKELWVRFDIYIATQYYYVFRIFDSYGSQDGIYHPSGNYYWIAKANGNEVGSMAAPSVGFHSCLLHLVSDTTNGKIQFWVDDASKAAIDYTGSVKKGNAFSFFFLESDNAYALTSNVIISDTELSLADNCDLSKTQWIQPVIGKNGTFGVDDFAVRRSNGDTTIYKIFDVSGYNIPLYQYTDFYIKDNVSINRVYVNYSISGSRNTYTHTLYQSDDGVTFEKLLSVQKKADDYYALFDLDTPATKHYYRIEVSGSAGADGVTIDATVQTQKDITLKIDTHRDVSNAITQQSDTARHLAESIVTPHDTARALAVSAMLDTDTRRILSAAINPSADTVRYVSCDMVIHADTVRALTENIDVDIVADTARNLYRAESLLDDTTRKISNLESINADIKRTVTADAIDMLDTVRTLTHTAELTADTVRDVAKSIDVDADTARITNSSTITLHADTSRQLANDAAVSADTMRDVSLTLALSVDLSRDTGKTSFDADVVRDVYVSHIDVLEDTIRRMPYTIDNNAIQSITLTIEEHTISDKIDIKLVGANYMPKDSVRGKFLDYPYNMMILSTTQDKDGIVQTISALYDYYKFNMSRYDIDIYGDDTTPSAAQIISRVASSLGYKSYINLTNFTPSTTGQKNNKVQNPYPSILSDIIGWTQQLPWRQINIFLHGDTLYAIQRGNELNVVDMTGRHITRPNITRTIFSGNAEIGVFQYMSGKGGKLTITDELSEYGKKLREGVWKNFHALPGVSYDAFGNITHYYGTVNYKGTNNSSDEVHNAEFDVSYTYDGDGNITSKTETTQVFSSWGNDVIDTWTNTENYANNRNTFYTLTNGDDAIIGTHPNRPSNVFNPGWTERITFSRSGGQTYFVFKRYDAYGNYIGEEEVNGDNVGSTPFPLYTGDSVMKYLEGGYYNEQKRYFDDLKNHVGMIQETLIFDIVDPVAHGDTSGIHVIDLRDKVRLDGKIYYLVRNVVSMTSKQLKQSLEVVRWF